jgi:hypothetical protein
MTVITDQSPDERIWKPPIFVIVAAGLFGGARVVDIAYNPEVDGRRMEKVEPLWGSLVTRIEPPWCLMIWLVMDRPSPVPPGLVVKNGWNNRA